jgi:hypothetical protein
MPTIQEVVDVTISVQSSAVARVGFDSALIAGNGGTGTNDGNFSAGFVNHDVRKYTSLPQLVADVHIKPDSDVIKLATATFAQIPAIPTVYVARIDEGTPAVQISTLTFQNIPLITGQSVEVKINGSAIAASPVAWVTDHDTTMAAIASAIQAESGVATAVSSTVGGGDDENTITITGTAVGVSFQTIADVKTGTTVDESIAQVITTPATDKILGSDINAIVATDPSFFGYVHTFTSNADAETAAAALAANKKVGMFKFATVNSIPNLGTNYSSAWYTSSADANKKWIDGSAISTMLGREIGSYNPAYLSLELTDASKITASDEALLRAGHANQYSNIGGSDLTYNGRAGNGGWIDTYINVLWVEQRVTEDVFAVMKAADKVPYSDAGIVSLAGAVSARLQIAEDKGIIAKTPKFTVEVPLVSDVSAVDKANHVLDAINFTAYVEGSVSTVKINGTIIE